MSHSHPWQQDLERIPVRTPIIDRETFDYFSIRDVDRHWRHATGAILRNIQTGDDESRVTNDLVQFARTPVTETLPNEFIGSMDGKLGKMACAHPVLEAFLNLPAVPDAMIGESLRNPTPLVTPRDTIEALSSDGKSVEYIRDTLYQVSANGSYANGVTDAEINLVSQRYRYARDVKFIALGAELSTTTAAFDENGTTTLPSGISISIFPDLIEKERSLLDPNTWQYRKQLKDRVYEIGVDGRRYILKEQKTLRHKDVPATGGILTNISSRGEVLIAREFEKYGKRDDGQIELTWESPIGAIEYPDGFNSALFAYNEQITAPLDWDKDMIPEVAQAIMQYRQQFENEYQAVLTENSNGIAISFADFAIAKADLLITQANELLKEVVLDLGYCDSDQTDHTLYIKKDSDEMKLSVIGYDFEYFSKLSDEELAQQKDFHEKRKANRIKFGLAVGMYRSAPEAENAAYKSILRASLPEDHQGIS